MKYPLVSIITPCFNGETFVMRCLDSILQQTYPNIEFIFVNDGSNDRTEEIVESYREKFLKKGIKFLYFYQRNRGQASALNKGLEVFTGEYLTWPDSDDILCKDNIRKKVEFLEKNLEYDMVLCKTQIYKESDLNNPSGILERKTTHRDNLFLDLIIEKNVYYAPGGYMIRTSAFLKVNPKKRIYESPTGQNWQMLLPMAYHYRCGYLDDILYHYVVRENSHSRKENSMDELLQKTENHEKTLLTVVQEMNIQDSVKYIDVIKHKYIRKRFYIAFQFRNKTLMKKQYTLLKSRNEVKLRDWVYYYLR